MNFGYNIDMNIVPFILLGVLSIGMGAIYTIFHKREGWQGIVIKGLTMFSILIFVLVNANLREITNALPLFMVIAMALLILSEAIKGSQTVDENSKLIVFSIFNFVSITLFAVSAITLSSFSIFALLGGILAGLGLGLIVCAFKKIWKVTPMLMEILVWIGVGLLLGFSLAGVLISSHFTSALLILFGAVFMVAQRMVEKFGGNHKVIGYLTNAFYVVALILMTTSIYFY